MTGFPAAVIHSHLTPEALRSILTVLWAAGAKPVVLTPADLPLGGADPVPLRDALKGFEALIVDERVGEHAGLEYVLFCRSLEETRGIHITLLHSQEENVLLTTACFLAGVDQLAHRDDPAALRASLDPAASQARVRTTLEWWTRWVTDRIKVLPEVQEQMQKPARGGWMRFTASARKTVFHAQQEAQRRGGSAVGTEHLLLGLVQVADCAGTRILTERCGVPLARVTEGIGLLAPPPGGRVGEDMQLDPRAKGVVDMAGEEADALGHAHLGTEHLLLALVRERDGVAGHVLERLGVELEALREIVKTWQKDT